MAAPPRCPASAPPPSTGRPGPLPGGNSSSETLGTQSGEVGRPSRSRRASDARPPSVADLNSHLGPESVFICWVGGEVPILAGSPALALVLAVPDLNFLAGPGERHRTRRVDRRGELLLVAGHIHLATRDIVARAFRLIRTAMLQSESLESWVLIDPCQFVVRDSNVACGTRTRNRRTPPLGEAVFGSRGIGSSSRLAPATDLVSNTAW